MRITEGNFLSLKDRDTSKYQIYRIDRAYESIYLYNKEQDAYLFECSFCAIGAERKNRDKTILKKIAEYQNIN